MFEYGKGVELYEAVQNSRIKILGIKIFLRNIKSIIILLPILVKPIIWYNVYIMIIIGLTGPIGAGKSEVAKVLKRKGAYIICADDVAHNLYLPKSEPWKKIVKEFGPSILGKNDAIDRDKLADLVFSDPAKLNALNKITHPMIKQKISSMLEGGLLEEIIVIDAALPHIFKGLVDEIWGVVASKEKRVKRLLKSKKTKAQISRIMKSQLSEKEYETMADKVIRNEGSIKQLNEKVQACLKF